MNYIKSLAKQLGPKGIRVCGVAPGPVWTPLQVSGGASFRKNWSSSAARLRLAGQGEPAELGLDLRPARGDPTPALPTGNIYGSSRRLRPALEEKPNMLEKTPAAVGHALEGVRAGDDKTFWADPRNGGAGDRSRFPVRRSRTAPLSRCASPRTAPRPRRLSTWSGAPANTAAGIVVVVEDPDSPTPAPFVHLLATVGGIRGFVPGGRIRRRRRTGKLDRRAQHHGQARLVAARPADRPRRLIAMSFRSTRSIALRT